MSFPFQTSYPIDMPIGLNGQIADNGFKNTLNPQAGEPIFPARGVVKAVNEDYVVMYPSINSSVNVFSGDLVTGNTINAVVNGVAIAQVTFATSHLATMNAIAAEIAARPGIQSAVVGGANNRTITVTASNGAVSVITGFLVTNGASQATVTTTNAQLGTFFGVSQFVQNKGNNFNVSNNVLTAGQEPYFTGDPVPTLTQGRIYIIPETVVTANSPVYVRFAPNGANTTLGAFRGDSDGGTCMLIDVTDAKWREGNGSVGLCAVLELTIS